MDIKSTYDFAKRWGDKDSIEKFKKSDKSSDVQKAEIENFLKDLALRFERSPNQSTLKLWASDIVDAGFDDQVTKLALKSVPYKFERFPTLSQVMELLRPYLPQVSFSGCELSDTTNRVVPHLKAKFLTMFTQEQLDQMCKVYKKHVMPHNELAAPWHIEMCVLNDWLRCYYGKGEEIIKQGLTSNEMANLGNKDYFLNPLKRYAKENNL
jgi:hypothetical protein